MMCSRTKREHVISSRLTKIFLSGKPPSFASIRINYNKNNYVVDPTKGCVSLDGWIRKGIICQTVMS